ncbi:MAG: hypothetical protein CMJ84_09775 [Planctomycetes bacterium]|nr:hypothetical protein [Planctomycetota bacterium]
MNSSLALLALPLLFVRAGDVGGETPDLAEGLARIERWTEAGEFEKATALADELLSPTAFERWRTSLEEQGSRVLAPAVDFCAPVLEQLGLCALPEPVRGELFFARGLVRLEAQDAGGAQRGFGLARSLGGRGSLRLAATYDLGVTAFLQGEQWRARILEQPAARPGLIGEPPPVDGEQPDLLAEAREAYLRARGHLVERLRADWRDADTRANVELVQRRLRWLEEQQRRREEQQQQQQDSEEDSEEESEGEEQEGEPSEGGEQQAENGEGDEDSRGETGQEGEEHPEEEPSAEEDEETEGDGEEAGSADPQEIYLTREEGQRMLDKLAEHEEQGEEVKARLYQNRRQRVERDW